MLDEHTNLLHRMRAGEAGAARTLWNALTPRLTGLAHALLSRGGVQGHADDVVQSAFMRVLELSDEEARAIRSVGAYLARAVHTGALNVLREHGRRTRRENEHVEHQGLNGATHPPSEPDPAGAAVDQLDEPLREAVLLRHVAGLTFDEMAEATGTPRATLASRHAAALARLRELMPQTDPSRAGAAR